MPEIPCNRPCEMEFYKVKANSARVTSKALIEGDTTGCLPELPSSYDSVLDRMKSEAERKKNLKEKAVGGDCAQGCPCDAKKTSDIFRNKSYVTEKWKMTHKISYNGHSCKYLIKGTYRVKTARVKGLCNSPGDEDDFGEFISYHQRFEDIQLAKV